MICWCEELGVEGCDPYQMRGILLRWDHAGPSSKVTFWFAWPEARFRVQSSCHEKRLPSPASQKNTHGPHLESSRNRSDFGRDLNHAAVAPPGWGRSSLEVRIVLCVLCHLFLWEFFVISATSLTFISERHSLWPEDVFVSPMCNIFLAALNICS